MSEETSAVEGTDSTTQDSPGLTLEAAREKRDQILKWGFAQDEPVLIEALPGVGKSFGIVQWAAENENPVSIFTARHDLYDQYEEWATDEFDLTAQQLPVFQKDCPTAMEREDPEKGSESYAIRRVRRDEDEHEEWRTKVLAKYNQGASGRELHESASSYFGEKLPCQDEGPCPYMESLERDFTDVDVLIGNFRQAFVDQYREDRYVVFDEFPGGSFIQKFESDAVSKSVSRFVSNKQKLPFDNWEQVESYDPETENNPDVDEWLEDHAYDRDRRPLYRGTNAQIHTKGPLLTEIALRFTNLENDWRRADLGKGRVAVRNPSTSELSLLDPPPTENAKSVIAIDGTPTVEMWELLIGEDLEHRSVFDDKEKREFLFNTLEIELIQSWDTTKPYRGGGAVTANKDMSFIEAVKDREGQKPSLISSGQAIQKYNKRGLDELIQQKENYNGLKGSNKFETDRLGIVIGCDQPDDDSIERWGALAGYSVSRKQDEDGVETKGIEIDFGPFGNRILKHTRENDVLQAAMRFGREEVEGQRGATVYVHTAAIPEWVQPEKDIPQIYDLASDDGVNKVVEALKAQDDWPTGEWKTSKIAESIDALSDRQVLNTLKDPLSKEGYIESRQGGRGNGHIWSNVRLDKAGTHGLVTW